MAFIIAGVAAVAAGYGLKKVFDDKNKSDISKTYNTLNELGKILLDLGEDSTKYIKLSKRLSEIINKEIYTGNDERISKFVSYFSNRDDVSEKNITFAVWGSETLNSLSFMPLMPPKEWVDENGLEDISVDKWAKKCMGYREISDSDIKKLAKYIDKIEIIKKQIEQVYEYVKFYSNYLTIVLTRNDLDNHKESIVEAIHQRLCAMDSLVGSLPPIDLLIEDNIGIAENAMKMRIHLNNMNISVNNFSKELFENLHMDKLSDK
ncbi:hypothetical protein BKK54_02105 [Rodentibacter genomosp. 1]|uniref:Uncharacterized protein n=1 Tax=Rodentibacter genomosp. 1 TaxID=1908264 RepID=A0A1V3J8P9_9PAST|nr:hypothetical protein [Rodentibacter genomosp. 1]OOF51793.1 hypothetical protein BKK54_02105 [Rodentibacter genomosp. 1]